MKKVSKQSSRDELARAILAPRLRRVGYLLWLISFALLGYALSSPPSQGDGEGQMALLPSYNEEQLEAGLLPLSDEEHTYRLAPGELATPYLYLSAIAFALVAAASLTMANRHQPLQSQKRNDA